MTSTVEDTTVAPESHEQWSTRADEVAAALATDVVERERDNVSPTGWYS